MLLLVVDALAQILFLAFIVISIILVVTLFPYIKRWRNQLDRMERILDDLSKQLKREAD